MKITKSELREIIREEISKLNKQPKMSTRLRELINKGWVLSEEGDTVVNPETGRKIKVSSALSYKKDHPAYKAAVAASGKEARKSGKTASKGYDNFEKEMGEITALMNSNQIVPPEKTEKAKVFLQDKMDTVLTPQLEKAKAKAAKNNENTAKLFEKAGIKFKGELAGKGIVELAAFLDKKAGDPKGMLAKILSQTMEQLSDEDKKNFQNQLKEYDENVEQVKAVQKTQAEHQKMLDRLDYIKRGWGSADAPGRRGRWFQ
jgi:hypothetical protein